MISRTGDEPEVNTVLAEKLRSEFGIEIPELRGASIEDYMTEVGQLAPKNMVWRVRRQVAIGVFPSARMAMYKDLDTSAPTFQESEIVRSLLAGSGCTASSPFADDYEIDRPEIESKVPCLVMDADSSQFSTLVDVADGKNVAVEGPPGTGKSQTIVNAIAAALAEGKKVLFVAEKLAALNVVKSRLEAVGLGEFLLPLQAERSGREQVIQSIRDRLEIGSVRGVRDYDEKIGRFRRTREQLARYIELLTVPVEGSGLTVRDVIGKSIATNWKLDGLPRDLIDGCRIPSALKTRSGLLALRQAGAQVEKAYSETASAKPHWNQTGLAHPDRFTIEEACALAARAAQQARELAHARVELERIGLGSDSSVETLKSALKALEGAAGLLSHAPASTLARVLEGDNVRLLESFVTRCLEIQRATAELSNALLGEPSAAMAEAIAEAVRACGELALRSVDPEALAAERRDRKRAGEIARVVARAIGPVVSARSEARSWRLSDIGKAHGLLKKAGREVLALRNRKDMPTGAAHLLRKLCEEGRKLSGERAAISDKISLAYDLPLSQILECLATLRAAGPLRGLSSRYRSAKRLFLSISKSPKYLRQNAIADLNSFISFRQRENDFGVRATSSSLFGLFYRGLDTDFDAFGKLADFYDGIESTFAAVEHRTLRSFLREAEPNELDLIPALPVTELSLDYDGLGAKISEIEADLRRLKEGERRCAACVTFLSDRAISPDSLAELPAKLNLIIQKRGALDGDTKVSGLIGPLFNGCKTSCSELHAILLWSAPARPFAGLFRSVSNAADFNDARTCIEIVLQRHHGYSEIIARLNAVAKANFSEVAETAGLIEVADELERAAQDSNGLLAHATLRSVLNEVEPHGVMQFIRHRMQAGSSLDGLAEQCEALAVRQMAKAVFAGSGAGLAKYRGAKLNELRSRLAELDREIIGLSRLQLRARLKSRAKPPSGNGIGKKSGWTEMALLDNEISKKQRFLPVRDITQRAGRALLELKPCWMMSPLAVAQYVPKGLVHFDLCIIDEASQMPPESALGALLRCGQTVVVGDTNQLPPTNFFKTVIDDEEADEDDSVLNESILEMANATFRPARRLRWHYRSRHSGLIKFSNRLIYDDDLIVFPSATESMARMGVEYHFVEGRYKGGTNPVEAQALIEAAVEFMRMDPDRSLGIVTLNQKQRDLILEEFEFATARHAHVQRYIENWKEKNEGLEEFFIKNLENVQGDERDVIFIGTVYGPEEPGARVMQRFGPINGLAGKRRLNVLFTRAKEKVVTFSSMTAADVEADEHGNPGAYILKRWLEYAASGVLDAGEQTPREPDSDFEIFIINQIRAMGCIPVPQVGVSGYFIDIGVRHPEWPHGYVLGVECDGATYHSAKSARDRDRLRQQVLENLGWRLHRIWSTDWFNDPRMEAERLRVVISATLDELKSRAEEFTGEAKAPRPPAPEPIHIPPSVLEPEARDDGERRSVVVQPPSATSGKSVEIGDTVRVRYLTDDKKTMRITISRKLSDPAQGVIHWQTPIAKALLGAEEGDEVDVLVGSYVRPAVIESIFKDLN